jgi:beta-glucosidase
MDLPGRQDELVEAVAAANPNTVVVVNAGSPVTMDWASDDHVHPAPAVVTSFFAGQEQAEAMVDVLLGDADPGGRLPTTYPARLSDHPAVDNHQPVHSPDAPPRQRYAEGLFIGHRHYERASITPRFWFGHGLSYGTASWGRVSVSATRVTTAELATAGIVVGVPVSNDSDRSSTVVVQGYVAPVAPPVERPARELKAWAKTVVAPGSTTTIDLVFGPDAFHHWDEDGGGWTIAPGEYDIVVAHSSDPAAEHDRCRITIE